jgi:transcriptional regulator
MNEQVHEWLRLRKNGWSFADIAKMYDTTEKAVHYAIMAATERVKPWRPMKRNVV